MVSKTNGGTFAGAVTVPQLNADNIRIDGNTISAPIQTVTSRSTRMAQDNIVKRKLRFSTSGATPTYSHTNNGEGITLRYNDDSGARAADIVATATTLLAQQWRCGSS